VISKLPLVTQHANSQANKRNPRFRRNRCPDWVRLQSEKRKLVDMDPSRFNRYSIIAVSINGYTQKQISTKRVQRGNICGRNAASRKPGR
jgi:hypothetical protein